MNSLPLPVSAEQLKRTFDGAEFVKSRKGIGGPQPESVNRMLKQSQENLTNLRNWITTEKNRLGKATEDLNVLIKTIGEQ